MALRGRPQLVPLALALGVAGCDFGIGTDPHPAGMCAPGHARESAKGPCVTSLAPSIVIDGSTADWAAVPTFPIDGGSLALAGNVIDDPYVQGQSDLLVRAIFDGGRLDELVLDIVPSPVRPASGGTDHITVDASGTHYQKNGMAVTPAVDMLRVAWTADGLEASVSASWLTYQGAARLSLAGTRGGSDVVRADAVDACYGFRTGAGALPTNACEAP